MKKKILHIIREYKMIEKGMHIVIGLSGGPDSLCMFDVLCSMAEEWELKLYPVHVNHKFRPGAAEDDQVWVENWCRKCGWPCTSYVYDCSAIAAREGLTSEEAGRKVRYEAFGNVAGRIAESGVPIEKIAIAVGQNANDQCETLLFRLMRGTGVDGLAGIAYKRWDENGIAVIRPLLNCTREEIEDYCRKKNLQPRRDHTNEEPVYMRNRIRLELIPFLQKEFNPNLVDTLNRLASAAAQDAEYIGLEAEKAWKSLAETGSGTVEFSAELLDKYHPSIRIRLYNKALEQIGLKENISAAHLDGIESVLRSESPSARWNLPDGYMAERRYDRICFFRKGEECDASCRECAGRLEVRILPIDDMEGLCCAECEGTLSALTVRLDLGKLQQVYGTEAASQICLRTRENGDFMTIRTGGGLHRKKLQDILVDLKIPKTQRDNIKLAAIGKEILWILPLHEKGRITSAYKAEDDKTEMILVLEYLFQV